MAGRWQNWIIPAFCLMLAACNTPRGAGFQSEVLAATKAPDGKTIAAEFEVQPVTRMSLVQLQKWPENGNTPKSWIRRQPQSPGRIIAAGDRLSVSLWDTESNSLLAAPGERVAEIRDLTVNPDGTIALPFVGTLKVAGLSPADARAQIEERYVSSVPSAQVQLQVLQGRANAANLVSGVAKPGVYPLPDSDYTLLSLLAEGGGVEQGLKNPQVRLMRGGSVYGISVSRLFGDPGLDTTLRGGDRVIVEEDSRYFLSLGAAGSEALHVFPKDQVSALDALSLIGGVQDSRANPRGILILREYPRTALRKDGRGPGQERVVFTLDLTSADGLFSAGRFAVLPGDLVYATESRLTSAKTVFGLIGSVLGIAANAQDL